MTSISQYLSYLEEQLWCVEREKLQAVPRFFYGVGRVLHLSSRRFEEHKTMLRASALTLFSMLAVVPVLATLFGIAKGFGLAELVESEIREAFASQEQVMTLLVSFSKRSLEQAKGGLIAGIGVVLLLWAVVRMIGNVEEAFNTVWSVRQRRTLLRRFTDYVFLIVLLPLMLVFSSSASVALTDGVRDGLLEVGMHPDIVAVILLSAQLIPALLLGAGFAFLYVFLPNTRVQTSAAMVGGMTTAILFLLTQWLYIKFQFALASYGAIYGSFAALPLFLIWLQAGWVLVLFGAELTRAIELRDEYEFEPLNRELSLNALFIGVTKVTSALKERLETGKGGANRTELSEATHLPKGIVQSCCDALYKAQILTIDEEGKYVPIVATNMLDEEKVLALLKQSGRNLPDLSMP